MISLELYRVFYMLAKAGSISKAAERLYVTQPAVSQALQKLEDALSLPLCIRTPRGIRLTKEGELLYTYIQPAIHSIQKAEAELDKLKNLHAGEVRIGASDTICMYFLPKFLRAFQNRYPGIGIHVTNRTSSEIATLLRNGMVDFGIINMPLEDETDIQVQSAASISDCFVAGAKYESYRGKKIPIEKLPSFPLNVLEKGTGTRRFFDAVLAKHGLTITPALELGSVDLLVAFAAGGLGISFVIKDYVEEKVQKGELFIMDFDIKIPKRQIGIATAKRFPLPKAAGVFVDLILDETDRNKKEKANELA